jgi:hypothetical protein
VLDIGLPDLNGIEVARAAIKRHPSLRIVALSGFADRIYIEEMLKAGAHGYVVKSAGADELVSAIRAVAGGSSFLSPEATQVMLRHIQPGQASAAPPHSILGKREREVLSLLAGGKRSADGDRRGNGGGPSPQHQAEAGGERHRRTDPLCHSRRADFLLIAHPDSLARYRNPGSRRKAGGELFRRGGRTTL